MTANQVTFLLLPVVVCFLAVWVFLRSRKLRKSLPPQIHEPQIPGAGYDAKEIARSKGNGMADGGIG